MPNKRATNPVTKEPLSPIAEVSVEMPRADRARVEKTRTEQPQKKRPAVFRASRPSVEMTDAVMRAAEAAEAKDTTKKASGEKSQTKAAPKEEKLRPKHDLPHAEIGMVVKKEVAMITPPPQARVTPEPPKDSRGLNRFTPDKVRRAKAEDDGDPELTDRPEYSERALLRLVNLVYDPIAALTMLEGAGVHPSESHLLSLTKINSSKEAWFWAHQITKEAAYRKYVEHIPVDWPLSQVLRVAFLLARRSITNIPGQCGPGFTTAVNVALEQNIIKQEEAAERADWTK